MLYPLLSPYIGFPLLGYILNGLYFALIILGLVLSGTLFIRQLARAGYPDNRLRAFTLGMMIMVLPLGIISSRSANMFYFSPDQWSVSFFIEQFFSGPHQTYHAALILPFMFLLVMGQGCGFEKRHLADSLFACIPLGHAVGRFGCLLVGCCWGNPISFSWFGITGTFHNPVPLYSIIFNLFLFGCLNTMHHGIYAKGQHENKGRMKKGMIVSFYLMGYGGFRFMLEWIRTETIVGLGMTLAQWSMLVFMGLGLIIGVITLYDDRTTANDPG